MDSLESTRTFFGWCTVINMAMMVIVAVAFTLFRSQVARLHSKLFGLDEKELEREYFRYMANYKIVALVFSLVPYVALVAMT